MVLANEARIVRGETPLYNDIELDIIKTDWIQIFILM